MSCAILLANSIAWAQAPLEPTPTLLPALQASESGGLITLSAAIDKALANSPRLRSMEAEIAGSRGEKDQAGAWPNPEADVEVENIAGDGTYKGFDSAEITYGASQLFEIGGKRSARKEAASQGYRIARIQYEITRLDLIRDVTVAYVEAVAAKEAVALAEKQRFLAAEVLQNVAKRVEAAAEPLFQRSKSEVALATSEVALDRARRDYTIARKQLATLWGSETTGFDLDTSSFYNIAPAQTLKADLALSLNPDIVRWEAEEARTQARLALEEAKAIPDPRVSVGVREFNDSEERAFLVGVSIPIPLFDLNSGNIAKARSDVMKAASDKHAAKLGLSAALTRSEEELANAYRQADALKTKIIPAAEKAYSLSRQGYEAGKFPYLEVLDAQRTLVDARTQYNDALKVFHSRRAEVARVTEKNQLSTEPMDE
jgi:cobalt-zinc-cadmium efflux system outer membrane protein